MIDAVRGRLDAGDRAGAVEALEAGLARFIHDHFAAGRDEHPFLEKAGVRLLQELAGLAPRLFDDPLRAEVLRGAVEEIRERFETRQDRDGALFRAHNALCLLWPGYPLGFEEALQEAKLTLGGRASNVEGALDGVLAPTAVELRLIARAVEGAVKAANDGKLERILPLRLGDFDVPEGGLPGYPAIGTCDPERLGWSCPACEGALEAEVGRAGQKATCACGAASRVPIPSLARMAALLRARRDERLGVGRCRVCGAVIQKNRSLLMKAGFCTALCAREGPGRFREYVPASPPDRVGEELLLVCACGSVLEVPAAAVATRVPCKACGLGVWIPEPAAPPPRRGAGPRACGACGRIVKAAAKACLYCGAPQS